MNELRLYELLKRQQRNELTPEEKNLLDEWYNGLDHSPEAEAPIQRMKARVWSTIRTRLPLERKRTIHWLRYAAAASIITIGICSALYLMPGNTKRPSPGKKAIAYATVRAPHNEQVRVALNDGSVVWLNGDAVLDYPNAFDSVRNVYLRQGEAFFEVTRDTRKPFIVHSQRLHTEVLGTSFNIRNRNGQYMVAVASGKVKVYYKETAISNILVAGQRLITDSIGSRPVVDSLDKNLYKGWTEKAYHIKDISLTGIAFCMESLYGANIQISREELKKLPFTTSFSNEDRIEEILSRLSLAGDFQYKIDAAGTVIIY